MFVELNLTHTIPGWRSFRAALYLVFSLGLVSTLACDEQKPSAQRVQGSGPGPGDSLAKLSRRTLETEDPAAAANDYMCEIQRLIKVHGPRKAMEIQELVEDTIYKPEDDSARRHFEGAITHRVLRPNCPED